VASLSGVDCRHLLPQLLADLLLHGLALLLGDSPGGLVALCLGSALAVSLGRAVGVGGRVTFLLAIALLLAIRVLILSVALLLIGVYVAVEGEGGAAGAVEDLARHSLALGLLYFDALQALLSGQSGLIDGVADLL